MLVALALAAALNGAIALTIPAGPLADLTHYKHWAHLISVEGMHAAYSGEYPQTYAIYPPVTLATFRVAGALYQRAVDPSFDLDRALTSHTLSVLLRLQALLFHLLVGLAVLVVARQIGTFGVAYGAMVAYLFNPGVVFDVADWGQPDPVFGLFVLLALAAASWGARTVAMPSREFISTAGCQSGRAWPQTATTAQRGAAQPLDIAGESGPAAESPLARGSGDSPAPGPLSEPAPLPRIGRKYADLWAPAFAGLAISLAALAKPQAWIFLPLVIALVWRRGGFRGWVAGGVAGALGALGIALPFLLHGTLHELVGLPRAISSVMPVVTANAHNLWWLFSGGAARWYLDGDSFVGPLSYRLAAIALVGALAGLALLRAVREPKLGVVVGAGAYTAFGFFMAMTQIHENHMYVVFPLLAVAAVADRRLWSLYAVLALTWAANMLLHDFDVAESVVAPLLPWPLEDVQRFNALVNVLVLAVWTAWLGADTVRAWLGRRAPRPAPRPA